MHQDDGGDTGVGLLFVTHNLALIRTVAQHVAVMSGGSVIEAGVVAQVLDAPRRTTRARSSPTRRASRRPAPPEGAQPPSKRGSRFSTNACTASPASRVWASAA
jgi:peptide/nickel transport system permease protein